MNTKEKNNGWIKLTDETELNVGEIYWFFHFESKAMWTSYINKSIDFYSKLAATHYQPILTPKPLME